MPEHVSFVRFSLIYVPWIVSSKKPLLVVFKWSKFWTNFQKMFLPHIVISFSSVSSVCVSPRQRTPSPGFCDGSLGSGSWWPSWEGLGNSETSPAPPCWKRKSWQRPRRSGRTRTTLFKRYSLRPAVVSNKSLKMSHGDIIEQLNIATAITSRGQWWAHV